MIAEFETILQRLLKPVISIAVAEIVSKPAGLKMDRQGKDLAEKFS